MKIPLVCEGVTQSSVVAQPWKHVFEIARRMKENGNDVQIVSDRNEGAPSEERIGDVTVRRVRKRALSFDQQKLLQVLNEEDVDVVNWHGSDVWSALRFSRLRKSLRKNVVWTLHSGVLSAHDLKSLNLSECLQLYKFWNNIANAAVPKSIVRRWTDVPFLRHIITLSKRTATKLSEYYTRHDITCIPSGVDTQTFRTPPYLVEDPLLLYFGPISSFRGVDTLLSAFGTARERIPSARLVFLARETDEKNPMFRRIRKALNVEVVASIMTPEALADSIRRAAIVVLPFKFWPQVECPLTILEAMAAGKAVITTSIGAISEIVDDSENGVIVPANDSKALSDAIVRLLNDPAQRERLGRNARSYVERFHDWHVIVRQTLDVLRSCA